MFSGELSQGDRDFLGDSDQRILLGEGPRTCVAVLFAATTECAFEVVALLAERLPVTEVIAAASKPWNPVVLLQFNFRWRTTTNCAARTISFAHELPIPIRKTCAWNTLGSKPRVLELVGFTVLLNSDDPLLPLKFSDSPEWILVRSGFSRGLAEGPDGFPNLLPGSERSRQTVTFGPKTLKNHSVVTPVRFGWRHEPRTYRFNPIRSVWNSRVWDRARRQQVS